MDIISRSKWGARSPRERYATSWSRRTEFVVHYSEGPTGQSVRSIQDFHMDGRRWSDIGYNFLVTVDGRIYEGRGWLVVGAHAENHNTSGIGVCMIGRDGDDTPAARRAIRWLYDEANRRAGRTLARRGHRDVYPTDCPGEELYEWVRAGMPVSGTEDDMPLTKADAELVARTLLKLDAVAAPPWKAAEGNEHWTPESYLHWGYVQGNDTQALVKQLGAKLDAQQATIDKLVDAVAAGPGVDVEALKAEIREAIESVSVRLDVTEEV